METFRIQTSLSLGGNLGPEMIKLLRRMEQIEAKAKAIPRDIQAWERPILNAAKAVERLASEMKKVGAKGGTPKDGLVRWAASSAKELGEARKATQGVGSAARGVGKTLDGWEGKINRATKALERMERVASAMRLPAMPGAPSGGGGSGRSGGSANGSSARRGARGHGGHGYVGHEGSALAGMVGVGGGMHTIEKVVETGIDMQHIALGMRQTGASDAQVAEAKRVSEAGSKAFPNLSTLEIFEHVNDLRGILGTMDKAIHEAPDLLPEFAALKAKAGNRGSKVAIGEIYNAVKSAETANEITSEGVKKHVNSLARLAFWYGDKLNPSSYFSAQKNAGQMLNLTSDRFRFGAFSALTQEVGQRAGTQYATFSAKGTAGLRMMVSGLDEAAKYGLLDISTIQRSKNGRVKPGAQFSDIGLDGKKYDRTQDPDLWLYKNVIPKLKAGGINSDDKAELLRVLGKIFTDKNAYGFLFTLAQQRSKIDKDWSGFVGTSGDFRKYLGEDGMAAVQGVQAQANALMTALSGPAIPGIVENLGKLNTGLASVTGFLERHPGRAATAMGAGLSVVGGLATAGAVALTVAAVSTLSLPALAIGAIAAVTIGTLSIPWDRIWKAMGFGPGVANGGKDDHGVKSNAEDGLAGVGPSQTQAQAERDTRRRAGTQGLGNDYNNTADAVRRLGETTGRTGHMAEAAVPLLQQLGNALLELARKAASSEAALNNISFNVGGGGGGAGLIHRARTGGGSGAGSATPTRPEVGPPPAQRELQATLQVNLDGRRLASAVSRHQFDAANRPATAANFSDASEMYPQVG